MRWHDEDERERWVMGCVCKSLMGYSELETWSVLREEWVVLLRCPVDIVMC